MRVHRWAVGVLVLLLGAGAASAVTMDGGGPKRKDCVLQLMSDGVGFPAGKSRLRGVSCSDGDYCDADGTRNGVCRFLVLMCANQEAPALKGCSAAEVTSVATTGRIGKGKKGKVDTSAIDAAVAAILPTSSAACASPVPFDVPVSGPNNKGELNSGRGEIRAVAKSSRGKDKDRYRFTCLPNGLGGPATSTTTPPGQSTTSTVPVVTTSTIVVPTTTTTLPAFGMPGPGLVAEITGATVGADGTVTMTFILTDGAGVPLTPMTSSTDDPAEARVRFTIARLEVIDETSEGFTTTFTRYRNYVISGNAQPTFDSGGTLMLLDAATGTWRYTFATQLPGGFANLTHTIGAQIQRAFEEDELVANPIFDFVPAGGPVTTMREAVSTAQCNQCHNPLALHGGGRREVRLCQLCHTDQAVDPDTGNTIDFKHMIHRIHRGKDLPSVADGPLGAIYEIIGFNNSHHVYAEKVKVCEDGPFPTHPCEEDADCCFPGEACPGTCTGEESVGVGFPRNVRDCTVCHAGGATVENYLEKPSTLACTGCHDDVNPGETETDAGPPGTGHLPEDQPEAFCRVCHTSDADEEFDISIPGAHTIPERSTALPGLNAEILTAVGAPGGKVTITFRLTDKTGTPIASVAGFRSLSIAMNGPNTDFGAYDPSVIRQSLIGGSAVGMLTGPDGSGIWTYETDAMLPAEAAGTWRVGMEARRTIVIDAEHSANEAAQNPWLDFSVDGSPVEPRRTVVAIENCQRCHGVFSETFSIHGGLRNQTNYCVLCHNPNANDYERRAPVIGDGANPVVEPIVFKRLIHRLHTGEELGEPYIIYGFNSNPADLSEVRFPGDRSDCHTCHVDDSYELPLPAGLLPTIRSIIDPGPVQTFLDPTPPIQSACLACHNSDAAAAHAETNTTMGGAEACNVCHAEGALAAVSEVHHHGHDD